MSGSSSAIGGFSIGFSAVGVPVSTAYYLSLITSQHSQQPNFVATVALSVQPYVDGQGVLFGLPDVYDLDEAVGVQLDTVGLWVGVTRYVSVPLPNVYFTWGSDSLGWNQGVWQGVGQPTSGLTELDDETFRLLIMARIIANSWNGSVADAMRSLSTLFTNTTTPGTLLFIQDNLDMTMTFAIAGELPSAVFQELFASGELDLKPVGVRVNYVETSVNETPIFGWGMENGYVSGWGVGAWAVPVGTALLSGLEDNGGVLQLTNTAGWPTSEVGLPAGSAWSNGGVVNCVPGHLPNPTASAVFIDSVNSAQLLALGVGNLPYSGWTPGSGQLVNPGGLGEIQVA